MFEWHARLFFLLTAVNAFARGGLDEDVPVSASQDDRQHGPDPATLPAMIPSPPASGPSRPLQTVAASQVDARRRVPLPRIRVSIAVALLLGLFTGTGTALSAEGGAWSWVSPRLKDVAAQELAVRAELDGLGAPVVGQTAAEFGYQHPRLAAEPPSSPWIQVDLGRTYPIDWIALVPAQVDWQTLEHKSHAFPRRFRVDVSDDAAFATFSAVMVATDADFPEPGIAPVALRVLGLSGRYVRLTVTKMALENAQYFYALAELMVVSGRRNLAIGQPVTASATVELPPRWAAANLADSRTPLGPPLQRELLPYDGLYAGPPQQGETPWMGVDLGRPYPIHEVRLHPIHARFGADIPGFSFPARFRIEAAGEKSFAQATVIYETGSSGFPNPGNNPVTLSINPTMAQYVRIILVQPSAPLAGAGRQRFGLSELEVFSDDVNVARWGRADASVDPVKYRDNWPIAQLNDGFASYGRLVDLPDWLDRWQQRSVLNGKLTALIREREALEISARERVKKWSISLGLIVIVGAAGLIAQQRRRRTEELDQLRTRLARDLHDEMGSNLAGLAVLSETLSERNGEGTREDWREVNRIARETTDAMREVLWLVGAREEAGLDFVTQMRRAAERVLPGKTVQWEKTIESLPPGWPIEARRQMFLFFKEALANIARHAQATEVGLALSLQHGGVELQVRDNGRGFNLSSVQSGVGLTSLRARAKLLRGTCAIETSPGHGTRITLTVPVGVRLLAPPPVV